MKSISIIIISFVFILFSSCQKEISQEGFIDTNGTQRISIQNPGFEQGLDNWTMVTEYTGKYGFKASVDAVRTGVLGLNFYAAQTTHWEGAPQETPWNGLIYQNITGLQDGTYIFKVYADAVGTGMYVWADGGNGAIEQPIKSEINELNNLVFEVEGGEAKIGFICIDASGAEEFAPYFHADDVELWKK